MQKELYIIILFSIFAFTPLFHSGFYDSDDKLAPIFRLMEMDICIKDGDLIPRWSPDLYGGRGAPFFNFYSPFSYYFSEIFHLIGFDYVNSIKITIALSFILSGIFMYLFARDSIGRSGAFFASILYMYAPYRLFDVYVRGALAESFAFVLMPLVLLSVNKMFEDRSHRYRYRYTVLGGFSYAYLIMTHNVAALLFTAFLVIYIGYLLYEKGFQHDILLFFIIGLGLSSFFWLPALIEKQYVNIEWIQMYKYSNHFFNLNQIISPASHLTTATIGNKSSLQLGIVHLSLGLAALFLVKNNLIKFFSYTLLFTLFLTTPYSKTLWDMFPLADYVQFPWRILTIGTFLASFLGGAAISRFINVKKKKVAGILVSLLIVLSSFNFIGTQTKILFEEEEDITPQGLREIYYSGTTYGHEYLPRGAALPDSQIKSRLEVLSGDVEIYDLEEKCSFYKFEFDAKEGSKILVNTYSFPGWTAYIDHEMVEMGKDPGGLMVLTIPEGRHEVDVKFEDTLIRKAANFVSFLVLTTILILFYSHKRREIIKRYPDPPDGK